MTVFEFIDTVATLVLAVLACGLASYLVLRAMGA